MTSCDDDGQGCCPDKAECISDHCDGRYEPGSAKADEVEQHLATCTRCAEALEDYKAISAAAKLLKAADCSDLDVGRLKDAVKCGLRRVVLMRRLAWGGAIVSATAAVAAAVIAMVTPFEHTATPALANESVAPAAAPGEAAPAEAVATAPDVEGDESADADREALIQQIIADLKAKPGDFADERVRDDIRRRLREAGLVAGGPDPMKWIVIEDGTRMPQPVIELRSLIQEIERSRGGRGVLKVDDSTR